MTTALKHRGPDAEGFYHNQNVGLGHRRLSILDLSESANQPFYSNCGRYVMVYNGEVYNYKEIAKKYRISSITTSDTEVILESFVKKGISILQEFNGMFAIAIWDKQEQQLTLIRDRMGIKPVFYYWDGINLAFSSETKALLTLPIAKDLNLQTLKDYFFLEYIPKEQSAFKNIKKLAAGSVLTWKQGKLNISKYYDILEKVNFSNIYSPANIEAYKQEFKEIFASSVQLRQISDVSIGAFLSGGVDSSLVCSTFQQLNENPIKTFNIGFNVKKYDESAYASSVAQHLDTDHYVTQTNEQEALSLLDDVMTYYDEPFAAPSAFPSILVCQKAREYVTVALSGDGGDELFMGYNSYVWHDRFTRVNNVGGFPLRKTLSSVLNLMPHKYKRAADIFDIPSDYSNWLHIWSQDQGMFSEKHISHLFGEKYQHQALREDWKIIDSLDIKAYEKISLFDIQHYLSDNLLYKMDIASMRSSLEVRLPFLDHRVVEFALSLPLEAKVNKKEQKFLLKKVLEDFIPKELVYRPKWGFPAPLSSWLNTDLKYLVDHYLDKEFLRRQDIFNPKFVSDLVNRYRNGEKYQYKKIWSIVFFQLWYEKLLNNEN